MRFLLALSLGLLLLFMPSGQSINAEVPLNNEKAETKANPDSPMMTKREIDIDNLLGPEPNFPFLPDNHRDSGTGKFNSF